MTTKELLKQFKSAPWKGKEDVEAFVRAAPREELDFKVIDEMLDMMCSAKLSEELHAHNTRCAIFTRLADKVLDKALFVPYVKALKAGDMRVRAAIMPLIPKVNNPDEHTRLCGLLKAPEPDVRQAAAEVIKQVGGKTALQTIAKLSEDKDFAGRLEAMDAAVAVAGHHAIPVLQIALDVGKPPEKIKALKYLGDPQIMSRASSVALKAVVPALEDRTEKVAVQAVASFCAICDEDNYFEFIAPILDSSNTAMVRAAVAGLRGFCSPRVIAALDRKLRAGPNPVRSEVLLTLEAIGNDEVLPPLVDALGHKQPSVRTQAGEVLAHLSRDGKLNVARVIIWLLRSRDVNVRRMAVEIARSVRDPSGELWPKLLAFLRDEDWWVRERVVDALVEMAGKQLTPHMVGFLKDPYDVVRRFAVDVLIRIKDPQALGALVNAAREDADWWTREKAVEAIASLKDQRAIPYIVDIMRKDEDVQLACVQALKSMEARPAAPYVAGLLSSSNRDLLIAAMDCLSAFDATEFSQAVQNLMLSQDQRVVRKARELLTHWNVEISNDIRTSRDKAVSFLDRMLMAVCEAEGDDLVLASNRPPYMKRMGKMVALSQTALSHEQITALFTPHLTITQLEQMKLLKDVDFSYEVKAEAQRFRVNIFQLRGGLGGVFRRIKGDVIPIDALGLPPVVKGFAELKFGLVLVGGPTGSGKSTTLAALIDHINRTTQRHVISLEDPIEVVHASRMGLVNQREIGTHTHAFGTALRSTLREDPDVILIGEMRDLDTISFAVTAAETGHLVFGTVHTVSADTSLDRLINAYPPREQEQVRNTLAENLKAVVCQYLLKRKDGPGRVVASEIMVNNDAIANLVRKGKTFQIQSVLSTSRDQGMQLMDHELMRLYKAGVISAEDAYMKANVKKDFEEIVGDDAKEVVVADIDRPPRPEAAGGGKAG
ncbi:MAG: PilT/PilU family type 4a pilus ATPase [Deltaproteobacteria bacterium]|nr:PilT/PilU family type 4a pilus ATPase [Deltaproteobacteria bacterium]